MGFEYDYADGWTPNEGDTVEGTIVSIAPGSSAYGDYPILTIEKDGGDKVAVHAFHQTIMGALARFKPQVGDVIGIQYRGKRKGEGKDAMEYHDYRVSMPGKSGFDWGTVAPNPAANDDDPLPS